MKTYMALDTEDDSRGNVYCINFYDGKKHHTFMTQESALEWLTEQKGHIEIWCVNLGYDLNNLFKNYLEKLEIIYVGTRIISSRIVGAQVYFRDTLNHWKLSVAEIGKRLGIYKIRTRSFKNVEYCQRDTLITYKFVMEMKEKYEAIGCTLKATIGSTALEYYYNKFGDRPSQSEILSTKEIEFIKKGYYGGRTEIFFGKPVSGNIQYFDINSLYPSVMRDFTYPRLDSRRWVKSPNFENEGMAEVTVQSSTDIRIPYLPCRSERSGLLFPIGKFRGVYTYYELRNAQELGYRINKVHKALEFDKKFRPFVQFIETLYEMRLQAQKNGDELLSDSAKLIMNNLYGKFGQGNEFTKLMPINDFKKYEGVVYGNLILTKRKGNYPKHANGIWACYTTAYARDRLYRGLVEIESNGGLLIYCDTDSIIFESDRRIIKPSNQLGEFKLEGEFRYAHFKLPKLYCLIPRARGKWIYRAKGVRRNRASEFFRTGKAEFKRPNKLRECLRRNLNPKRLHKLVPNYWEMTKKETRKIYDKRFVQRSGHTIAVTLRRD